MTKKWGEQIKGPPPLRFRFGPQGPKERNGNHEVTGITGEGEFLELMSE